MTTILNKSIENDFNLKIDILKKKISNNITDLNEAKKLVNLSFELHQEVIKAIQVESLRQKNKTPDKQNWDFWEKLENDIKDKVESVYFDIKSIYYDLHWDKHGFNAY